MTDYLGNLLARSFAPAEQGVRPRTPSMFEPASPALLPGRFLESATEGESPGEPPLSDTKPTRPVSDNPAESRDSGGVPARSDRPAVPATEPTVARITIPVATASAASANPEKPSLLPRAETAPVSLRRSPVNTGSTAPHDGALNALPPNPVRPAAPAGEKKTALPLSALPVAPLPPPASDPARRDNRSPTVDPLRSAATSRSPHPGEPSPPSIAAHRYRTEHAPASIVPKQAARAENRPDLRPATAETPPTIQVTIGRVEVRATTPATPARPKSKKEPEMSLEAYLARRAEGDFR
jgi:hypothetical protein